MATLDNFRNSFRGVRGNRFRVMGDFPNQAGFDATTFEFYCKAASIPGSSIGMIPVGYKGRPVKFSGERTYSDWVVQIYESSVVDLRERFEQWIDFMDSRNDHEINYNVSSSQWSIFYDDVNGTQSDSKYKKEIRLINCFPIDVSPIEMSYDVPDTFAEFTVTIAYDRWEYAST
jgi:hypothetical protein